MAITKKAERQGVIAALVPFTFADFAVSGTFYPAVDLPGDAIVSGGFIVMDTVFNSATSDTLTVGDSATDNRYKAGVNGAALGLTALIPTGKANAADVGIKWTGVGTAPTTGAGRLYIEYIRANRGEFTQD